MALVEYDQPYGMCPVFYRCEVNDCPLSTEYGTQKPNGGDFEFECTLTKKIRMQIASHFGGLKYGGLTRKEYVAREQWLSKSVENKKIIITKLNNGKTGKV